MRKPRFILFILNKSASFFFNFQNVGKNWVLRGHGIMPLCNANAHNYDERDKSTLPNYEEINLSTNSNGSLDTNSFINQISDKKFSGTAGSRTT